MFRLGEASLALEARGAGDGGWTLELKAKFKHEMKLLRLYQQVGNSAVDVAICALTKNCIRTKTLPELRKLTIIKRYVPFPEDLSCLYRAILHHTVHTSPS